jgi:hypothetical protein
MRRPEWHVYEEKIEAKRRSIEQEQTKLGEQLKRILDDLAFDPRPVYSILSQSPHKDQVQYSPQRSSIRQWLDWVRRREYINENREIDIGPYRLKYQIIEDVDLHVVWLLDIATPGLREIDPEGPEIKAKTNL